MKMNQDQSDLNRRDFLKGGSLTTLMMLTGEGALKAEDKPKPAERQTQQSRRGKQTLFPTHLPGSQWVQFQAEGFSQPACGVIYRLKDRVSCGMPLGVIDTGCIDLETSGLWGYCSIFNTHVPRRGPLNLPFLGISVGGQTWVLCDPAQTKRYEPPPGVDAWGGPSIPPGFPITLEHLSLQGVQTAREIHYWGHYPVADLEYETNAPVRVGLRAWAPFLPGDIKHSLLPGSVFELHLRNPGKLKQKGTVAFSFPGPLEGEAGAKRFGRYRARGSFNGVVVTASKSSYALGVIGRERGLRLGGELGASGVAWARIAQILPEAGEDHPGASAAVDFALGPGETKVVRFLLTWHCPQWKGGGYNWREGPLAGNTYTHTYAKYYSSALEAAQLLAREHETLLRRILAWQEAVYAGQELPVWLRESLVNVLHVFTEVGLWPQARPPIPDWVRPDDGLFGLNESPRGCPDMECLPCTIFAQVPLIYFFPELALSNLRGYKGYQNAEGALPIIWSGFLGGTPPTDFVHPLYGYQTTTNNVCYLAMVYRYWLVTGDEVFLREFYPSLKKAIIFMVDLNRGPDGIVSMPDRIVDSAGGKNTEWYEMYEMHEVAPLVSHAGGLHLAALRMAQEVAEKVRDREFAQQCRQWVEAGINSMETKMWNGTFYLDFLDTGTGKKSEDLHAFQLDGEYLTSSHGLPGVFRSDRVKTALDTIKRLNVGLARHGALALVKPDGTRVRRDAVVIAVLMLAMNYMYQGQRKFGDKVARSMWEGFICEHGVTWDMPTEYNTDTGKPCDGPWAGTPGERFPGNDYANSPLLWALPAALEGKNLSVPVKPGGLVDRVLRAAREQNS